MKMSLIAIGSVACVRLLVMGSIWGDIPSTGGMGGMQGSRIHASPLWDFWDGELDHLSLG